MKAAALCLTVLACALSYVAAQQFVTYEDTFPNFFRRLLGRRGLSRRSREAGWRSWKERREENLKMTEEQSFKMGKEEYTKREEQAGWETAAYFGEVPPAFPSTGPVPYIVWAQENGLYNRPPMGGGMPAMEGDPAMRGRALRRGKKWWSKFLKKWKKEEEEEKKKSRKKRKKCRRSCQHSNHPRKRA